jgi:prevent-host-death family protein
MQVNIYNAKMHLSDLINRAVAGEEIIIARDGKPMVRLVPVKAVASPWVKLMGSLAGKVGPIPRDFDQPMPEEWFDGNVLSNCV